MPKRDELYYVLMNINNHQHYEDCKSKLEEGKELTKDLLLDMVKDLPEGEEPINEPLEPKDYPDKKYLPPRH